LQKIDPDNYTIGNLMSAFFSLITTTFAFGQALPYLKGNLKKKKKNI